MVAGVAAAHGLSAETVAAIVAKTDGVPLFVEELTKSVMESAGDDDAVPATLKDSLMARLDRLGDAREVAQIAAVIGRQFTFASARSGCRQGRPTNSRRRWRSWWRQELSFPRSAARSGASSSSMRWCATPPMKVCLLVRRREWHARIARRWKRISAKSRERAGFAGLSFRRSRPAGSRLRLSHARRRSGRQPLGLCGGDRAFHGGSQARRSSAAADRPAPATGFSGSKLGSASVVAHGLQSAEAEDGLHQSRRDRREAGRRPRFLPGQMGPVDQRQSAAQDRVGARPRQRTGVARATLRRSRAVARSLSLPAGQRRIFGAMSAACWRAAGTPSRFTMCRSTVTLAHAFGGHDPCVCAHAQCGNAWQLSGEETTGEAAFHAGDRTRRNARPSQQSRARRSTTSAWVTSLEATARPPSRRRIARQRWRTNSA